MHKTKHLPVPFYGSETLSRITVRVFEHWVLRGTFGTKGKAVTED
jgi:hypothetical protein